MTGASPVWQGISDDISYIGEYATMKSLGHDNGDWRFEEHRKTWITEDDIKEIASYGLNTVRVPIGYWIAGFDNTGGHDWEVYAPGGINYLDKLIKEWAVTHNIAVLISIHGAKGSQSGSDNTAPTERDHSYWS
jgi:glucan 1,3-beta-glucosidase